MQPDHLPCDRDRRCCRERFVLVAVLVAFALIWAFGRRLDADKADRELRTLRHSIDALAAAVADTKVIDELRATAKELRSAVAAESAIRGQQVTSERSQRRRDIQDCADWVSREVSTVVGAFLDERKAREISDGKLSARIDALEGRATGVGAARKGEKDR
jgi:hypothetical protein